MDKQHGKVLLVLVILATLLWWATLPGCTPANKIDPCHNDAQGYGGMPWNIVKGDKR